MGPNHKAVAGPATKVDVDEFRRDLDDGYKSTDEKFKKTLQCVRAEGEKMGRHMDGFARNARDALAGRCKDSFGLHSSTSLRYGRACTEAPDVRTPWRRAVSEQRPTRGSISEVERSQWFDSPMLALEEGVQSSRLGTCL